eukprot:1604270-Rhodomonas_salina.1
MSGTDTVNVLPEQGTRVPCTRSSLELCSQGERPVSTFAHTIADADEASVSQGDGDSKPESEKTERAWSMATNDEVRLRSPMQTATPCASLCIKNAVFRTCFVANCPILLLRPVRS